MSPEPDATDAQLRRSNRFFELSRDLICTAGADGHLLEFNGAWTTTLGWTAEELRAMPMLELVHPADREATLAHTAQVMAEGSGHEFVNRYRTKFGSWRWLEWVSIRAPEDGLIYASARDITERVRAKDAVNRSERLLADLLNSAPDAVVIVDERGILTLVNEQTEKLFGYAREELLGLPVETLLPGRIRERHTRHRAGYVAEPGTRRMGVGLDLSGRRKDGSEFPVDVSLSSVQTDGGRLVTAFVRDITERRQTEKELTAAHERALEASRLKSEFVANMSHEIRTPLNGVIGMGELLLETALDDEQREYAEAITASGDALMAVVSDILDFSKIEAGKLEIDRHRFDLREVVDSVCAMVAPAAGGKDLELMTSVGKEVPEAVWGDDARIRQVLANLATNAVKFTSEGEVVLRVTREFGAGDRVAVRFAVSDTGIGIDRQASRRIFDAFSQADSSTTRRYGGTGLGLAISRQLVELMGGRIGVDSAPGTGSTFWFTVPLSIAELDPQAGRRPDFGGTRVLVCDDNATNRTILVNQLGAWGMACDAVPDGHAALRAMRAAAAEGRPYALAVLDFHMPEQDGLQLARTIRETPALRSVRLVMLASSGPGRSAVGSAGIDGFVAKPVRSARLAAEITRVLGGGRSSQPVPAPPRGVPRPGPVAAAGRAVLVAEDNPVNQLVAVRMLEQRGFRVDVAADGRQAIAMHRAGTYELIFMDCQMPDVDGYAATEAIRRSEWGDDRIPIVAMTANTLKGDREQCLASGMDDYLPKPLRPADLDDVIARALGSRPTAAADPVDGDDPASAPRIDIVDHTMLDHAFGDDTAARDELITQFLQQAQDTISALDAALVAGDHPTAGRLAHSLKGSAAVVGATRLAAIAADVLASAAEGRGEDATLLRSRLTEALVLTDSAFDPKTSEITT